MGNAIKGPRAPSTNADRPGYVAYMVIAPDGGWGWVIVFIAFLGCLIVDGISFSFSIFRNQIAIDLAISSTQVAILSSLFIGMYFIASIIGCAIANRYGFRILMVSGGTFISLSFSTTGLLNNIYEMYLVYSIIGGISAGMLSIALILPPGFYFDKKRPIAMGLSACGTGMGAVCIPQVMDMCMKAYGWRDTFFIQGGMLSIIVFLSIFLRPLEPVKVNLQVDESFVDTSSLTGQLLFPPPLHNTFSVRSILTQQRSVLSIAPDYPTLSTIAENTRGNIVLEDAPPQVLERLHQMTLPRAGQSTVQTPVQVAEGIRDTESNAQVRNSRAEQLFGKKETIGARPLYRSDVLYHGSLMRLDEYIDKERDIDYHLEVTQPATQNDIDEEAGKTCIICPEAVKRGLNSLINFKLLKSPTFLCLLFSGFLIYISFYIPFLYIGDRARAYGLEKYETTLVAMIGIGLTIGRILSGIVVTVFPNFGSLQCTSLACAVSGLCALATTLYNHLTYQIVCMAMYGLTVGVYAPMRSIIIVDFLGLNNLTTATGMIIFCQGIGSLLGPPAADYLKNLSQNPDIPFYLAGGVLLLGSLFLLPMRVVNKWELRFCRASSLP